MSRSQLVYRIVPAAVEPATATVVLLHGRNGALDDLVPFGLGLAPELRLVAPEAARGVYEGLRLVAHTWFGVDAGGQPERASLGDSLYQLEQFVYDVVDRDGGRRPFLVGYDQGAVLALTAIGVIPDYVSGVVSIRGFLPELEGWTPPVYDAPGLPVLLVDDPLDPEPHARSVTYTVRELKRRGAGISEAQVWGAHTLDPAQEVVRRWLAQNGAAPPS